MSVLQQTGPVQSQGSQTTLAVMALAIMVIGAVQGVPPYVLAVVPLALWLALAFPLSWSLIFMAMSTFRLPDAYPLLRETQITLASGALAIAALFWHAVLARTVQMVWRPTLVIMLALLVLGFVGYVTAINKAGTWTFLTEIYWKIIVASLALSWLIRTRGDLRAATTVIIVSGILIGIVALYNKYHGIDLVEGTRVTIGQAFRSPIADPNDLALTLLIPTSLAMALAAMAPGAWVRLLAFAAMTVLIPAITVTQSRGGLLGVIAAIGVIALYKVRSRAIVFGLAACVGLVLFAAMGIGGRQSGGFQELAGSGIDESSYHRILAWRSAINMALANPLSGIGYAGFQDAFYFYTPEWIFKNMAPHSTWFGMLGEGGMTGLVLIVTMLVLSFTSLRRSLATLRARPDDVVSYVITIGLIAAMASFCVAGSFLGHHVSWTPYLLVALAAAVATVAERDPAREQRPGIVAPAAGSRVVPRTPRSPPDRRRPASPAPNPL